MSWPLSHNALQVSHHSIRLPRLPQAFNGLRVLQLSDFHFYEYTDRRYYDRVVSLVNEQQADVIAVTGDIIHVGHGFLKLAHEYLSQFQAKRLKIAILGNHDYYDDDQGQAVRALMADTGYQVLVNQHTVLQHQGNETLWFVGIDDLLKGKPDIQQAFSEIPETAQAVIVLAHNPCLFDPVIHQARDRVDLVLSGHTHAGHVYLPLLKPIYRHWLYIKYRHGLYYKGGATLHVSSGLGGAAFYFFKKTLQIALPRFRYNSQPEIAVLTLQSGNPVEGV